MDHAHDAGGWSLAEDPGEVAELLAASDRYAAERYDLPLPRRNPATTEALVRDRRVHVLRTDGALTAMFTLTWQPPYPLEPTGFGDRRRPAYLQRLAVRPQLLSTGSLAGVQSVLRAVEVATGAGADALRSEANPDLTGVLRMLLSLKFVLYGEPPADGPLRRVYLERELA